MGDRCSMTVMCRRVDAPLFEALGFQLEDEALLKPDGTFLLQTDTGVSPIVELHDHECNYAYCVACGWPDCELPKGVLFIGHHSAGDDYGPGLFAGNAKTLVWVDSLHGSSDPAVEVDAKFSKVRPGSLRLAQAYLAMKSRVQQAFATLIRAGAC